MCGYPLSRAQPQPRVLAAPVPSPHRYCGRPEYWTNLVVAAESKITRLDETFGKRFAFTTEDSQSGYQAPRLLLAPHAHGVPLFAATVGPLVTPRRIVDAITAGDADAGPLDSYFHDLLRHNEPEVASRLRVVAATPAHAHPSARRGTRRAGGHGATHCRRAGGSRGSRSTGSDPRNAANWRDSRRPPSTTIVYCVSARRRRTRSATRTLHDCAAPARFWN